ncbi:benzoate/H(+) symporter BenE family transporter [Burkholderia sp. Ac-20365]|jgi:benzoate membrane transport protein|uniref:benzoate/H(+) symporter BenE family transporter n=1 Tax=Burkholderia sp. Ac-20365 TaxID=2703897 RepID=UPI00197B7ECC|nr:benzoate/H(+) symporter BenE family transporter [Burkholderia sp. Ac-20365]MBN3763458.1 benzoate transporter [Burkholderia sp. Ac-20365]
MSSTTLAAEEREWPIYLVLAFVSMSFSATGPVAIVIAAARQGGLTLQQTSSWLFAALAINGLASVVISWKTKQPLLFLWTIPGAVLVAPVIAQYGFATAVGTYLVCAIALVVLGITNAVAVLDRWVPMPVVMAMIAALFLRYVLAIVDATASTPLVSVAMLGAFFVLTWRERRGKRVIPPIIGAVAAGALMLPVSGFHWPHGGGAVWIATPMLVSPVFNLHAISQLLIPLLVTVLFVQNAQGIAVIRNAGYATSSKLVTLCSGVLTALTGVFGGCPSVLAGPSNAILVSGGRYGRHYIAALIAAAMFIVIGCCATGYVWLLTTLPAAFVVVLAGLAMFGVLEKAFASAFSSPFPMSALVVFVVTSANFSLLGIGAPFWGVVAGCLVCHVIERP